MLVQPFVRELMSNIYIIMLSLRHDNCIFISFVTDVGRRVNKETFFRLKILYNGYAVTAFHKMAEFLFILECGVIHGKN